MMKLEVVEAKTWRWYLTMVTTLILMMLLAAWFAWHQSIHTRDTLENEVRGLTETNAQLKEVLQQKELELTKLGRSVEVSDANVSEVGVTLAKLQEEKKQLEKELSFYRSIMAPELNKAGLTIDSFIVTPIDPADQDPLKPRNFDFELILTQAKKQDWYIKGRYQIHFITIDEKTQKEHRHSMTQFIKRPRWKANFSFRYFQTFRESFQIPADFHPTAIVVTAIATKGRKKVEKRYPWLFQEKKLDVQQEENKTSG